MLILLVAENIFIKMSLKVLNFWIITSDLYFIMSSCRSQNKTNKQTKDKSEVLIHCELLIQEEYSTWCLIDQTAQGKMT